jgi:p-aminobenzoyl-glutamate transporter AbgT
MAPVLVPMFMLLSIAPETTQALYRIGDSTTNIISPMSPYFVVVLGFVQRYKRRTRESALLLSFTIPAVVRDVRVLGPAVLHLVGHGHSLGPGRRHALPDGVSSGSVRSRGRERGCGNEQPFESVTIVQRSLPRALDLQ